mgnify:CR=1 FL=1
MKFSASTWAINNPIPPILLFMLLTIAGIIAFIEMPGKQHSLAAIAGLNGKDLHGQPLRVNEARSFVGGGGGRSRRR